MKLGIVTISDMTNYGNRLQNYALSYTLREKFGCQVESLVSCSEQPFENGNYLLWMKNRIARACCVFPAFAEKKWGASMTRWANFYNWNKKHIPTRRFYRQSRLPDSLSEQYDLFFAGSDQIWNWRFPATKYDDYFLKFAKDAQKAALSASFGVEDIPKELQKTYAEGLQGFAHLSVREDAGAKIVKELTGRDVPVLIDPVMLLTCEEWRRVAKKPRVDITKPYVLKYYLGNEEDKIDRWAKDKGYEVYALLDPAVPELYSAGPGEFLSLIANAALVASDSFHCIAFSILFQRPFVVYKRRDAEGDMTSRLDTLLEKFSLQDRWNHLLSPARYLHCDASQTDTILEAERQQAMAYIQHALSRKGTAKLVESNRCTGCTACASACPKGCISMQADENGFLHPKIDEAACIHCGLCEKSCPVLSPPPVTMKLPTAYAVYTKDEPLRLHSSSGGVFSELAKAVLAKGGIVYGAAYDKDFRVVHAGVQNEKDLSALRGAKYAQSELGNSFAQIQATLLTGQWALFSGTPCQVAGLKAFLKQEYENLITVDFVCHSAPSPMAWKKYLESLGNLKEISLRAKDTGWSRYRYCHKVVTEAGTRLIPNGESLYMKLFVGGYISREACEACPFKGYSRCSDLTIGDFWGIWDVAPEMDDDKGTSVVLCQTERGAQLLDELAPNLVCKQVTLEEASRENTAMLRPSPLHPQRKDTLKQLRNSPFPQCAVSLNPTLKQKLHQMLHRYRNP